jgi:hypothetical protein|tara:strand:- start:1579 stop:1839 length:261 start_codon:yes stop_codon:yes gene_type:complete
LSAAAEATFFSEAMADATDRQVGQAAAAAAIYFSTERRLKADFGGRDVMTGYLLLEIINLAISPETRLTQHISLSKSYGIREHFGY